MTILGLSVDYVDHHDKPPLSMDDHFLLTMLTIMINRPYQWMDSLTLILQLSVPLWGVSQPTWRSIPAGQTELAQ